MGIYDKIFKPKKLVLSDGKVVEEKRTRTPLVLFLLLIATVISVRITGFSLNTILTRGNQFFVILGQMFPPKTGYLSSIKARMTPTAAAAPAISSFMNSRLLWLLRDKPPLS